SVQSLDPFDRHSDFGAVCLLEAWSFFFSSLVVCPPTEMAIVIALLLLLCPLPLFHPWSDDGFQQFTRTAATLPNSKRVSLVDLQLWWPLWKAIMKMKVFGRTDIIRSLAWQFLTFAAMSLDTKKAVNTNGEGVSTASVPETISTVAPRTTPTTTTFFDDEDETKSVEKIKKKVQGDAQMERDAEVALRLQAELDEELRVERERQEEASKVAIAEMFDEVQARMDADYELAARMTQEEQEKYTIEERARLLAEFFERRKKQLAAERIEAIKNKPLTKTQLRNLMITYLKNMDGYKHNQLKGTSYEEIQGLYERQQKRIQDFIPMDSEKEAQKPDKRLKRDVTKEEAAEYKKEKEELRSSLKIISNDDSEVDYEPLSKKFPIVNWEYQLLGKMEVKDMLVQERFQDHPLEGHDLLLWGDLRMIFDPDEKDELWMNQLD
ncbi:hypothetical protein Tco_0935488, partial [Tanacetum coccineum]